MVQKFNSGLESNQFKKNQIIKAALKRFSYFGVNKTTMAEIAGDVAISKANLYYYFADKTDLVIGVFSQLIEEMEGKFRKNQIDLKCTFEQLDFLLNARKTYFEEHYLLHMTLTHTDSNIEIDRLKDLAKTGDQLQEELIQCVFIAGLKSNELVTFDPIETSKVYLSVIQGIAFQHFYYLGNKDIPDITIFERIYKRQKEATAIFVNGLRIPLSTSNNSLTD